ncbi:proton-coupled amino acid transporter-like protein pathetic [Orussus abietinus]|uniref:proton-coupled amino acid transporter-like protein pathetic n=1 Tax=Orussus abietinus TaxID=222816 RepID=UPI000C715C80|nr:proton-coupled amino acid transporter-like protein pathetic [Orussus abietinus]
MNETSREAAVSTVPVEKKGEATDDAEEEYDPFIHRPYIQEQLNTDFAVFMHLLKAAIGSGILFLPQAFRRTGYVASFVCSVIIGAICIHTAVLTVQCSQVLCKRSRVPMLDFASTADTAFQLGPEKFRKYATTFNLVTNIFVCFVQYQTTVIYALYVATSIEQVIEHFSGVSLDIRVYLVLFLPIYLGLSLVPNLKYLVPITIMGSIFLAGGIFVSIYYFFSDFPSPARLRQFTDVYSTSVYCSIFMFAVHNMSILMPLENTMKNPANMPSILGFGMALNVVVYVFFGFLGYNKYMDACDTVIKNLPLEEIPAQLVKVAIAVSVMFTYGLQYFIPISIIWPMIAEKYHKGYAHELAFRLGGVLISTLMAIAVPQMASLLGLFSALNISTVMLLIPVMIETATKWERENSFQRKCLLVKNVSISVLWMFLMVSGAIESLKDIIETFRGTTEKESEICN